MAHSLEWSLPVVASPVATLLAAMGVARWLEHTGHDLLDRQPNVEIASGGDCVIVRVAATIIPDEITTAQYASLLPWILTAKNGTAPRDLLVLDYEAEKSRNAEYFARLAALRKAGTNPKSLPLEQQQELAALEPRPEWPVAAMINQMSAISAYNKAVERWAACRPVYPELAKIIAVMCDGQPGAIERAQAAWEALAKEHELEKNPYLSATQVVNPEQGKGANRAKADGLSIGGQESFWLLEYFKFVGLYAAALPRTVQGKKDRKTYVVIPSRQGLRFRWHKTVFEQFQQEFRTSSAIKMDVLAILRYTKTMVDQWQAAQQSNGRRRRPSDYVEGLAVVSFKDLGSAVAVMNVATLCLPEWVLWPQDAHEADRIAQAVAEHERIVGAIGRRKNEEKPTGDEERLLRNYRDFLSDRDPALRSFFAFTTAYAGYTLRENARRFTTRNLEVIIMAHESERRQKFKPIVENRGFRQIAKAIRQSTVTQQYHGDNLYDVRYGLADELHRHSRDNGDFLRMLGKFLQEYSQENSRVMERMRKQGREHSYRRRAGVSHEDIAQITELVDEYGAATVASLLIAFGYARESGTDEHVPDSTTEETEPGATGEADESNPDQPY